MELCLAINPRMEHHVYFWLNEDRQTDHDRVFF